jgi:eukaryotic-like serine/threonine-protein kinase
MHEPIQETTLAGHYQIVRPLGRGGFGQTFLAKDIHLPANPLCVIKKLQPKVSDPVTLATAKRLFEREAQTLARLGDHDQIPRLFAHFEQDEDFYLVQEFIDGQPLDQEIREGTKLSEASVIALLEDVLQVLAFVHEQNVIHRDIKPANLIRRGSDSRRNSYAASASSCANASGEIVLIDFGAVKEVSNQVTNSQVQMSLTVAVGSRGYMPNEQLAGNPRFSSDVYAVGMLGIQALTGIHPRNLNTDPRTSEVIWLDYAMHVSPGLAAVLECMVSYDFRDRYPTAAEALAALQDLPKANARSVHLSQWNLETPQPLPNKIVQPSSIPSERLAEPIGSSAQPRQLPRFASTVIPPTQTQLQSLQSRRILAVFAALGVGLTALITKSLLFPADSPIANISDVTSQIAAGNLLSPSPNSSSDQDSTPAPSAEKRASDPSAKRVATDSATSAPHSASSVAELLNQADRLRKTGQYEQAIATYDKALASKPDIAQAQWGRCYSLNKVQRATEAIAACDAALALKPNYPEALWSKGYAQDLQQRPQEALKSFEQAIALKPNFAEAWSNQGAALQKLQRYNEAIAAFDKATTLEPDYGEAWANRGVVLWSLGRREEAVASIKKAVKLQPENQNALKLLEQAQKKLER